MMNPEELRTLLARATEDRPAGLTLMPVTALKARRVRVFAPVAAAVAAAAAALVAFVVLPGGTASAQAEVLAAVTATGEESYHLTTDTGRKHFEGAVDPVRHLAVFTETTTGSETRLVDGTMYDRPDASSRWASAPFTDVVPADASALTRLVKLSGLDPQGALAELRTATDVRESGAASGDGWTGKRYAYTLEGATGTVDVDDQGRVRQLVVTFKPGQSNVMNLTDYGTPVSVTAPPADQVDEVPITQPKKTK